jgi:hypothetical protein
MTAMRLAEHVAGTVDVDGMLESMTPEQFDEWCAKDAVEPIGYASQTLGMIVHLLYSYMSQDSSTDPAMFMPWTKYQCETANGNRQAKQLLKQVAGELRHG